MDKCLEILIKNRKQNMNIMNDEGLQLYEWGDEDITGRYFRKKFQVEEMVEIKAKRWEGVWYIWVLEI